MATLFEYYKSIGQGLPSIADRAQLFQSKGLGSATEYRGTAEQNTRLLSSLSGGGTPPPVTAPVAGATSSSTTGGSYSSTGGGGFSAYLPYAQELYSNVYAPVEQTYKDWAAKLPEIYGPQKQNLEGSIPLIQQRYRNLMNELVAKDVETQGEIKKEGEAAVGETRARAGARGTFSSGIEIGQESKIGENVAKVIKSQAEGTERRKQEYAVAEGEETNKVRQLINDLVASESEAGFKIREAIAKLGPEKLDSAISLAGKILADQREQEKFAFEKTKYSESKSGSSEAKMNNLRADIAAGATLENVVNKYGQDIDPQTIYATYNSGQTLRPNGGYGPAKQSPAELARIGISGYSGLAEEGATTADAIDQAVGKGTRESALQELSIKESAWRNAGVDTNAVRMAIDTRFPPPKTSSSSGGDSKYWSDVWNSLKTSVIRSVI